MFGSRFMDYVHGRIAQRNQVRLARARRTKALWWLWRWGTPLPIPNREVKPTSADGTAFTGGRVGRCHSFIKTPSVNLGFFYAQNTIENLLG